MTLLTVGSAHVVPAALVAGELDADTRGLTERLIAEARVQERTTTAADGHGVPGLLSGIENPLRDVESAGYRLVVSLGLGLERAPSLCEPGEEADGGEGGAEGGDGRPAAGVVEG